MPRRAGIVTEPDPGQEQLAAIIIRLLKRNRGEYADLMTERDYLWADMFHLNGYTQERIAECSNRGLAPGDPDRVTEDAVQKAITRLGPPPAAPRLTVVEPAWPAPDAPVPIVEPDPVAEPAAEDRPPNAARHPDTPYNHKFARDPETGKRGPVTALRMGVSGILLYPVEWGHWHSVAPNGNEGDVFWDAPLNRCTANGRPYPSMREAAYAAVGYGPEGEPPRDAPTA